MTGHHPGHARPTLSTLSSAPELLFQLGKIAWRPEPESNPLSNLLLLFIYFEGNLENAVKNTSRLFGRVRISELALQKWKWLRGAGPAPHRWSCRTPIILEIRGTRHLMPSAPASQAFCSIMAAHFSPIIVQTALVLPEVIIGMIEPSAILSLPIPRTRRCGSTTAMASSIAPIRQVPTW